MGPIAPQASQTTAHWLPSTSMVWVCRMPQKGQGAISLFAAIGLRSQFTPHCFVVEFFLPLGNYDGGDAVADKVG